MNIYTVLIGYWDDIEYRKLAHFTSKSDAIVYANEWGFEIYERNMGTKPPVYYGLSGENKSGLWCNIVGPVEVDLELE